MSGPRKLCKPRQLLACARRELREHERLQPRTMCGEVAERGERRLRAGAERRPTDEQVARARPRLGQRAHVRVVDVDDVRPERDRDVFDGAEAEERVYDGGEVSGVHSDRNASGRDASCVELEVTGEDDMDGAEEGCEGRRGERGDDLGAGRVVVFVLGLDGNGGKGRRVEETGKDTENVTGAALEEVQVAQCVRACLWTWLGEIGDADNKGFELRYSLEDHAQLCWTQRTEPVEDEELAEADEAGDVRCNCCPSARCHPRDGQLTKRGCSVRKACQCEVGLWCLVIGLHLKKGANHRRIRLETTRSDFE